MPLHGGLGGEHASERAHAEGRVRIGLTGRQRMQTIPRRAIRHRLLRVLWHGIVFGVRPEDRSSFAERGEEGGGHLSRTLLDLPPFLAQQIAVRLRRAVLTECGFGIPPDLEMEV